MSLRARLVSATLALLTVGLIVAGASTYTFLRSFLTKRVDQQLLAVRLPAARTAVEAAQSERASGDMQILPRVGPDRGSAALVPPGTYAELRDADGDRLSSLTFAFRGSPVEAPSVPKKLPSGASAGPFTVGARNGGSHFRAIALPLQNGGVVVVAVPMQDVDATLHRLLVVELATAAAVLLALTAVSLFLIHRGLRPLDAMGETAGAIAAGDLSRRVEPAGGSTEIGRLGASLNAMLAQIEAAFTERSASEARLRRFLADASHELRTPLTSIRGWSELFRRGAASNPDDLARTMRHIEEEAAHMSVLVEDLLSLARLDEVRPLHIEPVDVTHLAVDAVESARAVQPDRPITVTAPPSVTVEGDATQLRQVLANLLTNAVSHTPSGTPVHVRVASDGVTAILEVADEGPGLRPEQAGRVFERFSRADPSRARTTSGGNGLGLAIVSAIAQAHGGTASVETAVGRGATFRVTLPVHRASVPVAPMAAVAPSP